MFKQLAVLLSLSFTLPALAFNQGLLFHKESLSKQKSFKTSLTMATYFYDQKLEHFSDNATTFKQRYFVDSQYAENESSPVFYIICGEWNCAGTGSYGYAVNLAKKVKAHLVALEHRYYGESLPMSTLSSSNLKNLNLESAIEDLAQFQKFMMTEKKLSGKWIAFGGSYAGTLSAFYRLKHPELVTGSLASSAPVFAKAEFFEYDAHVAKVINRTTCGDKVREAVALIEQKMASVDGAKEVKALFKASDVKLDSDFIYVVADMLAAAVQYGRDKVFCEALINAADPIEGYAKGGLLALSALGATPVEISFQAAEKVETTSDDYFRQWMWQSCREFGWFQVANGTGNGTSRSSQVDLKYHAEVCERLFQTPMAVDGAINALWYANLFDPSTTKIIFTNGANDPWLTLSVIEGGTDANAEFPLFMMEGAAHCSDLKAVTNIPAVIAAQASMDAIIKEWLNN